MKTLFLLLFSMGAMAHPHHHSLAIFDYNNEAIQLELSLKILSEDFEKINTGKNAQQYLSQHLKVEANSQMLEALFQGSEEDHEFMWFYYTFDVVLSAGNNIIEINDTILKSFNENQFNTVKITLFKQTQTHNFLDSKNKYTFVFE